MTTIIPVEKEEEVAKKLNIVEFITQDELFKGSAKRFCVLQLPQTDAKVVLPLDTVMNETVSKIADFLVRENDIIVASFPKAGTTWMQEIVYLIHNGLNFKAASEQLIETRFPFLEFPYPGLAAIEKMPSPRLMKTHFPYEFLPTTAIKNNTIYIARNPKDVLVSYYHFFRMLTVYNFVGSIQDFAEKFQKDELPCCPFFDHVDSYLRQKQNPNVFIVTYEELSKDPASVIQKVANFLGKHLSEEDLSKLVEHTSFRNMSKNPSANYEHWDDIGIRNKNETKFMRKGEVGDWKNYFGKDDNEKFDQWIKSMDKTQFPFEYEG